MRSHSLAVGLLAPLCSTSLLFRQQADYDVPLGVVLFIDEQLAKVLGKDAPIVDVMREALLVAVEIDGAHPLTLF